MKYRLAELLQCVSCGGDIEVAKAETRPATGKSEETFSCRRYCALHRTTSLPSQEECRKCGQVEIMAGSLQCRACRQDFAIIGAIPWMFEAAGNGDAITQTASLYGHLWSTAASASPRFRTPCHAELVEEALGAPIVHGKIGLDAGSGCGTDTAVLATRHPSVEMISMDISEGVYATRKRTEHLPNVHVVRGSVLAMPVRSEVCDFGYSFGVLHHTTNPEQGLKEITRVLKPGGGVSLYLYEDHADNPWKAIPLKAITFIRRFTRRLNTKVLSALCYILSPIVVITFSIPVRIMRRVGPMRAIADQMPFNFGTSLFSVHGDLLDRFGAPIEVRYSSQQVMTLLQACSLMDIQITKLKDSAGWIARGIKR
jgi:SAM-dependent methyltransferase/uncharacterized protein YbaR (Trm112 family)